ncbi:MAG: hypothetical protein QM696_08615 [Steroidobacteraceae bacterium]
MMTIKNLLVMSLAAVVLAGCGRKAADGAATSAQEPAAVTPAADAPGAFDMANVPVSDQPLGEFPYFGLPAGYEPLNKPETADADRFPFWVGDRFEWVEGRTWMSFIGTTPSKQFSGFEVRKGVEELVRAAGGVKVFDGTVLRAAVQTLGDDIMVGHNTGIGGIGDQPSSIYVVRRADRNIWLYLNLSTAGGSMTVAESAP